MKTIASVAFGGIELSITDLQVNRQLLCKNDCWSEDDCDLKRSVALNPTKNKFSCVTVTFNIKNFSERGWSIELGDWELIDTDGFAYRAHNMCDNLRPPRMMEAGSWTVSSGTQVNFMLVFPELENNKSVARILYVNHGEIQVFNINNFSADATKLFEAKERVLEEQSIETNWELKQIRDSIDRLEANIFSRLHNTLIPKEIQRLENTIQNEEFRIEQKLRSLPERQQKLFKSRFSEILTKYQIEVEAIRERERKVVDIHRKVSSLLDLTPREFEEYIAELYNVLGYENITLTPLSNDKGIDILMESKGKRYAVQCKKYKGVVGSPAIQTFIGAMEHAQASHGFFVTTSTFSIEAEKMASEHPIELIDSIKLGELIQLALGLV